MTNRVTALREILAERGLDALLVSQAENRRYLSGFTGSDGVLLITQSEALLATDFRYYEQVRQEAPSFELWQVNVPLHLVLPDRLAGLGVRRLGFEAHSVTVETYELWRGAVTSEWVSTTGLVEGLRQVKQQEELWAIEQAVCIADEAMEHACARLRPGMTERQLAWEIESYMRTHGADALSFTPIVASGPNGAMSHAVTSERRIAEGDPMVIDIGAVCGGYCSDLTRSFAVGRATDAYRAIWDQVLEAQHAAEAAIHAGMGGKEADAVARQVIVAAGHEQEFGHGLGHGVGLAIHEAPRASTRSEDILRAGVILTVEPGIYIPGWGGVRIEDMVVVEEDGCRVLTRAPKLPICSIP